MESLQSWISEHKLTSIGNLSLSLSGPLYKFDWCEPFDHCGSYSHPSNQEMDGKIPDWHLHDCRPCFGRVSNVWLTRLADEIYWHL